MFNHDTITKKEPELAKAVEHFKSELSTLRTGRASAALVENLMADFYGVPTQLSHMAQISIPEPRMIAIQPFDKNSLKEIEKAIQASNLGINPVNDGTYIRVTIPQMNEERRKELVKIVSQMAEKARVTVRNVRGRENFRQGRFAEIGGQVQRRNQESCGCERKGSDYNLNDFIDHRSFHRSFGFTRVRA